MVGKVKTAARILALIVLLASGYTIAYFAHEADLAQAKFATARVEIDFAGSPKINAVSDYADHQGLSWALTNSGNSDVYLRAKPGQSRSGPGFSGEIRARSSSRDWLLGEDGYYYYAAPVKAEETVQFPMEIIFDTWHSVSYPLKLEAEAVQIANGAKDQLWPDNPL